MHLWFHRSPRQQAKERDGGLGVWLDGLARVFLVYSETIVHLKTSLEPCANLSLPW